MKLSEGIESKSSKYAEEGTLAHALAEKWLTTGCRPEGDEEMLANVEVYVEWARDLYEPGDTLLVEHKFHLKTVHAALFGTADCVLWKPKSKTLIVGDLKYGAGVPVEVEGNPQPMYYSLGALLENNWPATKVVMAIIQPRCPHPAGAIRTHTIDALDLLDFADELVKAVAATEAPDAPLVPGDHCHWCPAAGLCPALLAKAQEVAKAEFRADLSYNPSQLAETLTWLPVLENWIKNVREFAYGEAEHGRTPPGWKLVEKRATRKWRDEAAAIVALKQVGVEPFADPKPITPAAAEKLLPKEQRSLLEELCIKESSGFALAPEDDKRPAARMDAKSEFEGL